MSTCESCGVELVPMVFTSFCPNDCDRRAAGAQTTGRPGELLGTLDWSGEVWEARGFRREAHREVTLAEGCRGFWTISIDKWVGRPEQLLSIWSAGDQRGPGWQREWPASYRAGVITLTYDLIVLTRRD